MKPAKNLIWVAVGVFLFLSFSFLLNLSPPLVESKSLPTPSTVSVAQNFQVNRYQILAKADELYRTGQTQAAANLYRKVKPPFPQLSDSGGIAKPIYDTEQLPPAAKVYWRIAKAGIEQNLESKIYIPLYQLTENYPEFIEGHLLLAKICQENPKQCEAYAGEGQPKSAIAILQRAAELYPDSPELLKAKAKALADGEEFLEASITARQFALFYVDYPEAPEFTKLADEYLKRYESKRRQSLQTQGILSGLVGVANAFITKDWTEGLSGLDTIKLLLEGESKFGENVAEQYKKQLKLSDDPTILNYVKGLAGRLTPLMGRDFDYEYYIVQDDAINAFALPGGKVFVNTGAILGTNSEAELAGLLSHEISHAVLSHGFGRAAQGNLLASLSRIVPIPELVSELVTKAYSRDNERQADILGTKVLSKIGYASDGLHNLMVTLNQKQGETNTSWLSTHPASSERVRYLENLIQTNNYNRYAFEGVKSHQEIQGLLKGQPSAPLDNSVVVSQPQPPASGSFVESFDAPSSPQPAASPPIVGDVDLAATLTRNNVEIRLEKAKVDRAVNFTVKFTIENRSSRPFGFVPAFAEVRDADDNKVAARFSLEKTASGDLLVPPGGTMKGQVLILGKRWLNQEQQNLTLIIKEGTIGGRVFRIPF